MRRFWVVALLVVPLAAGAQVKLRDRTAEVQQKLAELRAAGTPLTGKDLASPPVPAAENAAPLYLKAADLIKDHRGNSFQGTFGYSGADLSKPEDLAKLADLLRQDQKALDLVRQATDMPGCQFDTPYDDLIMGIFPHLAKARSLAYMEASAAVMASHAGHHAEALDHLRQGFVLVRRIGDEGLYLSYLAARAMDMVLERAAEHVLSSGPLPEDGARALAEELRRLDYHKLLVRVVRTERVEGLQLFDLARQGKARGTSELLGDEDPLAEGALATYQSPLAGPIISRDELMFLTFMDRVEEAAGKPWAQAQALLSQIWADLLKPDPELAEEEKKAQWLRDTAGDANKPSPFNPVIRLFVAQAYYTVRSRWSGGNAAALRAVLDGALGLAVYHQRNGFYPDSLAGLQSVGWPVPLDYYTGQPLIYRRQGEGFMLYSVGPDLKDDGGTPICWQNRDPKQRQSPTPGKGPDPGDIIWQAW